MSTPPVPTIAASCSFADQQSFAQALATQTANATNNVKTWRTRTFKKAQQSKVAPEFQELYPGKLLLQFHHGRKYDQEDLKAQDARAEGDRAKVLEREGIEKELHDLQYNGKVTHKFSDVGEGFTTTFPKPPGRAELDRRVARDQAGLWSLEYPKGFTRIEKVIAKKWGVDCDKEYWTDGTEKKTFMTTFFHGRRYDQDDWQAIDAKAVGDLSRELQTNEKKARSKYAGGLFPKEIEEMEERAKQKAKPTMNLNFPKLEKKQGIGNGEIIGLLDALGEEELKPKTKWRVPDPSDFECTPARPGVAELVGTQKGKIARAQQMYRLRKERERTAEGMVLEDAAFGEQSGERSERLQVQREELAPESPSVLSAKTSITVMRSEVSVSTPYRKEKGGL
ncbi:hypothetical protein TrST_g1764 [Triparma strigata]|uniref:Uncharacterized protein n=1 Tax=Triparma strigata TaxID=1606541 RepID=A0A9W7F4B1_9STRA|nr:hypothetical protein TrST_g1764 [Triparma strigata]